MTKTNLIIIFFLMLVLPALALTKADIVFPVAELGGCENEADCKVYCDEPDNYGACFAFAKRYGLLEGPLANKSEKELDKFAKAMKESGPGGCRGQGECNAYCDDVNNINECVDFADRNGLMSKEELDEAKKIRDALSRGVKMPGGCTNKESCESYCFGPGGADGGGFIEEHMDECIRFGTEAGFMDEKEVKMVKLTKGRGPGGCRGPECDNFCDKPENNEVCSRFLDDLMRENPDLKLEDIIPEKDLREMKKGFEEMKRETSPEMKECLAGLEPEFGKFFKGEISGSPSLAMKMDKLMPKCIEKSFPPKVKKCMQEQGLWNKMMTSRERPSKEFEKKIEECFMEFGDFGPPPNEGERFDDSPSKGRRGPDFEGSIPPGFGVDPEQCMRKLKDECDQKFTGDAGRQRCIEAGKKECFQEVKGFVPPGINKEDFKNEFIEKFKEEVKEFIPEVPGISGPAPEGETIHAAEFKEYPKEQFEEQYQEQYERRFDEEYQQRYEEKSQEIFEQAFDEQMQEQFKKLEGAYQDLTGEKFEGMEPMMEQMPIMEQMPDESDGTTTNQSKRLPSIGEFILGFVWMLLK